VSLCSIPLHAQLNVQIVPSNWSKRIASLRRLPHSRPSQIARMHRNTRSLIFCFNVQTAKSRTDLGLANQVRAERGQASDCQVYRSPCDHKIFHVHTNSPRKTIWKIRPLPSRISRRILLTYILKWIAPRSQCLSADQIRIAEENRQHNCFDLCMKCPLPRSGNTTLWLELISTL
jgi:hypothetical protein